MEWRDFFQTYRLVDVSNDSDLLYQVGASVNGKPISTVQFTAMINDIETKLELKQDDVVIDLCCGNGVLTFEIAKHVQRVIGIDGSAAYIKNAQKFKNSRNIKYILSDITDFDNIKRQLDNTACTKVLFYASLAYFEPAQLIQILQFINCVSAAECSVLIGSILDKSSKFKYFNTIKRRFHYFVNYVILRKDLGLGRWWSKKELKRIACMCNYYIDFTNQDKLLHTAHYRYDILLKKK